VAWWKVLGLVKLVEMLPQVLEKGKVQVKLELGKLGRMLVEEVVDKRCVWAHEELETLLE
jgi:hypothetical protein